MIPSKSEANLKNGNWFIYNDGINIIQVWGSNLNGKEKVYLNNELVSERRSVKKQSSHNFEDKDGQNYEVRFKMESLFKGGIECTIKKEGTVIKVFKAKHVKGKIFTLKRFLILIIVSVIFGTIMAIYKLPDFIAIIFILLVVFINFQTSYKGEIIIE